MQEKVLIIDFGGQYNELIARRVREEHIYCEVRPWTISLQEIKEYDPAAIIFTGGPHSVYGKGAPASPAGIYDLGIPILGICYGCQLLAHECGGHVGAALVRTASEYGKTEVRFDTKAPIFAGMSAESITWMSHTDYIDRLPSGFTCLAHSAACPFVAISDESRRLYGVQFHPEVGHTQEGRQILHNFLYSICGLSGSWHMDSYREQAVRALREQIGEGRVLLALSGGVDSSVAAALLAEAVGEQLTCVFVDHGLLRKDEARQVEEAFGGRGLQFVRVDAAKRFLTALAKVTEPEAKRKCIGEEFIRVFEEEAQRIGAVDFLAQGTIYPDVIESGKGDAAIIKSHHNVGGLPDVVAFQEIVEPLRMLFKDEVRELGRTLGLPEALVDRQPFPGPGLGIRVIGEVTEEKLAMLREADAIFREEIARAGLNGEMDQYFAALTNMRTVGVMGDERSYDYAVALRSVCTEDFMTADWARIPYDVLERISGRIINEVKGVNRVLYDITNKPPGTVEYE